MAFSLVNVGGNVFYLVFSTLDTILVLTSQVARAWQAIITLGHECARPFARFSCGSILCVSPNNLERKLFFKACTLKELIAHLQCKDYIHLMLIGIWLLFARNNVEKKRFEWNYSWTRYKYIFNACSELFYWKKHWKTLLLKTYLWKTFHTPNEHNSFSENINYRFMYDLICVPPL